MVITGVDESYVYYNDPNGDEQLADSASWFNTQRSKLPAAIMAKDPAACEAVRRSLDHFRPFRVEELAFGLVDALVGVGAEEVALRLQQIRGQALGAVAVVVGQ